MKFMGLLAAATLSLSAVGSAVAGWGVKYEVNSGSGWTTATTIDVSGGPKSVDFRISVYHDGVMQVFGGLTAWAPLRLVNSQRISNFSNAAFGDVLVAFQRSVSNGNAKALARDVVGIDTILGTPNSALSFSSDTQYAMTNPRPQRLLTQYYSGTLLVGNSNAAATSRSIVLTANSFGYPNAGGDSGSGGIYGASFYISATTGYSGVALQASTTIPATITVKTPCPADLNGDGEVGDADFQLFCAAHDLADCNDPAMPAGCPSDLNGDGAVDDADFVIFVAAYDAVACG